MSSCCNYTGTCRSCLLRGEYWFQTDQDINCCAFQPKNCGKSIGVMAETLADCKDATNQTVAVIAGSVLAAFFAVAFIIICVVIKKGCFRCPIGFSFRRNHAENEPMIPMVRFTRSNSVYVNDLVDEPL